MRVPARARWAAAAAGAIGLVLVTAAGTEYTRLVADARGAVHGALTGLVAALVIGNVSVRLALRALGWQLARYLPLLPDASHPASGHAPSDLWVVIPAHNEATRARRHPRGPGPPARRRLQHPGGRQRLHTRDRGRRPRRGDSPEPAPARGGRAQQGRGLRSRRGCRTPATEAPPTCCTDADTLPRRGWVAAGRAAFAEGMSSCAGGWSRAATSCPAWPSGWPTPPPSVLPRWPASGCTGPGPGQDSGTEPATGSSTGPAWVSPRRLWGRLPAAASGDLRTVIEDVALLNAARTQTVAVRRVESMTVEASLRRLRAWGPKRLLLWHWDRRWTPAEGHSCDIR